LAIVKVLYAYIIGKVRGGILMKKLMLLAGLACLYGTVSATVTTYQFSFTAADLMSYKLVDGADGSSAAANNLFDGARLKRDGTNASSANAFRSYRASQNQGFDNWAKSTTDRLMSFNLWGFDGLGANWGEDYKPTSWGTLTGPTGWTTSFSTYPWVIPDKHITDQMACWDANSFNDGFTFGSPNLEDLEFTFRVAIDSDDAFWHQSTNQAPNDLNVPKLTFWFGGYMKDENFSKYDSYEGNMVLTGQAVPEPVTTMLLAMGLGAAGFKRLRRK